MFVLSVSESPQAGGRAIQRRSGDEERRGWEQAEPEIRAALSSRAGDRARMAQGSESRGRAWDS